MSQTALLVIDVQNDYFPQGKMELFCAEQALKHINRLEDLFISVSSRLFIYSILPINLMLHFFKQERRVSHYIRVYALRLIQFVIEKHYPNSFFQTTLKAELERLNVDKLVISGMMTHMCVDATSRAAAEFAYQPTIITDATATRQLSYSGRTVEAEDVQTACLSAFQMFSQVVSIEDYLK